jgi:hypothetical protein
MIGPLGSEQIDYDNVGADSPIEALNRLHADALGTKAVRPGGDRLVFADPAGRESTRRHWEVAAEPTTGPDIAVTMEIPAVDPVAPERNRRARA